MALSRALLESLHVASALAVIQGILVFPGNHMPISPAESGLHAGTIADWGQSRSAPWTYCIGEDCDDGTEVNALWYVGGYADGLNCMGKDVCDTFAVGLRFTLPDLEQGQSIKYARLRPAAQGGEVTSCASLVLRGVDEDSPEPMSCARRPSVLPKTEAAVTWVVHNPWLAPGDNLALRCSSPDIAGIINEILCRPGWGQGAAGKTMILTIEGAGCPEGEANYLKFEDYGCDPETRDEAILEIFPSLADAFLGKPKLGRPTDTSVTVHVMNLLSLDIYAEYGTSPGVYSDSTPPLLSQAAGEPIEVVIAVLEPDTEHYYRIRYREPGDSIYLAWTEGEFRTQRSQGAGYDFTIQADSHLWPLVYRDDPDGLRLYEQAIENIGMDRPDFHISMGDFVHVESYTHRDVLNLSEASDKYLEQRKYLDRILHSIPFYLVLGNHEGEQGWRVADPNDSVAVWGALARKRIMPNPVPDGFYDGDSLMVDGCGCRGDYYSWEWGDALFVVLDPFWYTATKPHSNGGSEGSEDPWDWTLGLDQYNWLYDTLHDSDATWKFVFIHHLVGGVRSPYGMLMTPYGRGGIEAAKYKVDGRASYEWGGEDACGDYVFPAKRPGWGHGPIHDMLISEGVTILFHGHDHVFVRQVLDGVTYQACPQPSDASYGDGWYDDGFYCLGEKRSNSGHLRVRVFPDYVQVDYVRAVLPEDEPLSEDSVLVYSGQVSYSYSIGLAGNRKTQAGGPGNRLLGIRPNPLVGETHIALVMTEGGPVSVSVFDVEGRLVRMLFDGMLEEGTHSIAWQARTDNLKQIEPGVYFVHMKTDRHSETRKAMLIR